MTDVTLFNNKETLSSIFYTSIGLKKNGLDDYQINDIVQGGKEALLVLQNFFGVDYRKVDLKRLKEIADYTAEDFLKRFKIMEND